MRDILSLQIASRDRLILIEAEVVAIFYSRLDNSAVAPGKVFPVGLNFAELNIKLKSLPVISIQIGKRI